MASFELEQLHQSNQLNQRAVYSETILQDLLNPEKRKQHNAYEAIFGKEQVATDYNGLKNAVKVWTKVTDEDVATAELIASDPNLYMIKESEIFSKYRVPTKFGHKYEEERGKLTRDKRRNNASIRLGEYMKNMPSTPVAGEFRDLFNSNAKLVRTFRSFRCTIGADCPQDLESSAYKKHELKIRYEDSVDAFKSQYLRPLHRMQDYLMPLRSIV